MQRKMELQSLWPLLVAYFTAVNHYTLFTISQPIFNQQETAKCSHKSQSELLLQVRFPQMPSQAQLLYNPAETGGFILRMNLNKWIKFQRLWQIPTIWHHWVQDGLPSLGSMNTHAGSCLCCLWLINGAAAMAGCDKCGTSSPFGHSPSDGAAAPGTAGTAAPHLGGAWTVALLSVWERRATPASWHAQRAGCFPLSAERSQLHNQMLACIWFDLLWQFYSVAAHNISPYSPHCLSQYLACNVK